MPDLKRALSKIDGPQRKGRPMAELLATVRELNKSLGGRDLTKGGAKAGKPRRAVRRKKPGG